MSSSEEDQQNTKHSIKPENKTAKLDTSNWPLLLKVYFFLNSIELRPIKCQILPFYPYPKRIFSFNPSNGRAFKIRSY